MRRFLLIRWPRAAAAILPFVRFFASRCREDRCWQTAGALAYVTLLSIVPLVAVGLSVFATFPVFKTWQGALENFVFQHFVPAAGQVVQQYVQQFAAKASRLTAAGMLGLLLTALMVVAAVDNALNRIWRVQRPRSPVNAFLVYGVVLTWGPVLLGAALGLSSYLTALPMLGATGQADWPLRVLPVLLTAAAFTLLYWVVPQCPVRWRHALAGGLLTTVLFELAKRAFSTYITAVPVYKTVYGAFAAVPVFLIWLYVSWLVILLGAELAACWPLYRTRRRGGRPIPGGLVQALCVLEQLWSGQRSGQPLGLRELALAWPALDEDDLRALLTGLQQQHLVLRTENGQYALARDLGELSLWELYRCGGYVLPDAASLTRPDMAAVRWSSLLARRLTAAETPMQHALSLSLKQLFSAAEAVFGETSGSLSGQDDGLVGATGIEPVTPAV